MEKGEAAPPAAGAGSAAPAGKKARATTAEASEGPKPAGKAKAKADDGAPEMHGKAPGEAPVKAKKGKVGKEGKEGKEGKVAKVGKEGKEGKGTDKVEGAKKRKKKATQGGEGRPVSGLLGPAAPVGGGDDDDESAGVPKGAVPDFPLFYVEPSKKKKRPQGEGAAGGVFVSACSPLPPGCMLLQGGRTPPPPHTHTTTTTTILSAHTPSSYSLFTPLGCERACATRFAFFVWTRLCVFFLPPPSPSPAADKESVPKAGPVKRQRKEVVF